MNLRLPRIDMGSPLSPASSSGVTGSPAYAEVINNIPFHLKDPETLRQNLLDRFRNFSDVSNVCKVSEEKLHVAARALQLIFESSPLSNSGGYFKHALVQFFIIRSLRDNRYNSGSVPVPVPEPVPEAEPVRVLLGMMDRGLSLREVETAFSYFKYDKNFSISSDPKSSLGGVYRWYQSKGFLKNLSEEDQRLVINYAYRRVSSSNVSEEAEKERAAADHTVRLFSTAIEQYDGINWSEVFEWIHDHPALNLLALQRLKTLFSFHDSKGKLILMPHKVRDILDSDEKNLASSPPRNHFPDISQNTLWALNATCQTAYIEDPRLARRAALVIGELNISGENSEVRDRFEAGYQACVYRGYLEAEDLLAPFLGEAPLPCSLQPLRDVISKIGVHLVSQDDFNKIRAQVPGSPPACRLAFYSNPSRTLFVEKLPQDLAPDSPRGYLAFLERAVAVVHELVHAVQLQPVIHRGKPIVRYREYYPDRLVLEAEAGLVDGLAEFIYQGPAALPVAKALGLSLTQYFILRREGSVG